MSSTVLYARVSTIDQNIEHQEAQASAAGFTLDAVVADHGVSGISTRLADRPEGRRLFDMLRRGDTLVVRWVDRLGRNYADVSDTIREFMRRGVVVRTIIHNMTFDGVTKDPMLQAVRDALIAFMAATSQAQAEATKEAQRAGIDLAKTKPADEEGRRRYKGRKPSFTQAQFDTVDQMLGQGHGIGQIAEATGLSRQTVYRVRDDRKGAVAALKEWKMWDERAPANRPKRNPAALSVTA